MMKDATMAMMTVAWLAAAAWGAELRPGDVKLEDMKLTIMPLQESVMIESLPVIHGRWDGELKAGELSYSGPVMLPGVAWVSGALRPKSLVVTPAHNPQVKLVEGTDYAVDWDLWSVAGLPGSQYAGQKCHFEYDYTKTRLDLVEQTAAGKVVVKKGVEDKSEPQLPEADAGATPLLSVYLPPNTMKLTMENINLIDPAYKGVPPVANTAVLQTARDRMAAGKPVTIVFLGDSITAQPATDFRDGQGSYVDRFAKWLERTHPQSKVVVTPKNKVVPAADRQIVVVKAGVGGDDTRSALKRFATDVTAHQPDVVSIMLGVNDNNRGKSGNSVPPAEYKKNLETMVDKAQASGAAVILMTPSMKNLKWIAAVGNMGDYAAAMREVAQAKHCCLVDNYRGWQDAGRQGLNYMVLLGTCLNHPIDQGHQIFFKGLIAAFEKHEAND
jgi:lysophospholipase L1-like esterase